MDPSTFYEQLVSNHSAAIQAAQLRYATNILCSPAPIRHNMPSYFSERNVSYVTRPNVLNCLVHTNLLRFSWASSHSSPLRPLTLCPVPLPRDRLSLAIIFSFS